MSVEENKATIRRLYDEAWNKGDLSAIPQLVSPDFRYATYRGPRGYADLVSRQRAVFPDLLCTIEDMVGEGDRLAVTILREGTFKGRMGDIEPTGKRVSIREEVLYRFVEGKLVETVGGFYDRLSFFQQMGIEPPGLRQSLEENKATIRRVWDECNKGNLEVIDECFAGNFVRYDHFGKTMDLAGYKRMTAFIQKSSPDFHVTVDDMVAEGDKVAFRMTITGTNTGAVGPTPPSGKRYTFKEVYFARFEGGKIVEYVNLNRDVSPQ